jgi:hypothetical protein
MDQDMVRTGVREGKKLIAMTERYTIILVKAED